MWFLSLLTTSILFLFVTLSNNSHFNTATATATAATVESNNANLPNTANKDEEEKIVLPEDEYEGDDDEELSPWYEGAYNGEGAGAALVGEMDDEEGFGLGEELDSEDEEEEDDDELYDEEEEEHDAQIEKQQNDEAAEKKIQLQKIKQQLQQQQQQAKKKKKKERTPRVWESNTDAVMKIIDLDKHPDWVEKHATKEAGNKIEEQATTPASSVVKKSLREGSMTKSLLNTDHAADDEQEEEEEEEVGTYLPLPNLSNLAPSDAATTLLSSTSGLPLNLHARLTTMFEKATSHSCRAKIAEHFALFLNGLAEETKFPFEDFYYPNTCTAIPRYGDWETLPEGVTVNEIQYREYQPDKKDVPEGTYIDKVEDLKICYVILTHDAPEATIRLMTSLYVEDVTNFVIHVDGKENADDTYTRLVEYAKEMNDYMVNAEGKEEYIRIVPRKKSVRVNWGGFTMVEATLVALRTVFGLDYYDDLKKKNKKNGTTTATEKEGTDSKGNPTHDNPHAFQFHKLVHLASTTYPLASNTEIRDTLASHPLDANFLNIILRPQNPNPSVWNYFVECDDALHRIYRLPPLNFERGHGVDIYTSSQWFIVSRDFAWYLASPPEGSFVEYYLEYIEHVVVADESFFGTVLRNTHFCATLHNDNFLHIQFDRWENEAAGQRDARKCIMKNPDHCGRSPTTMTLDYLATLELSGDLFARKFDDVVEPVIKDYIDKRREKEEERLKKEREITTENKVENKTEPFPLEEWEFQGEGVLIVAKETAGDEVPLCLGLEADGNKVRILFWLGYFVLGFLQ